jgi:hypothetical protein
VNKIAFALLVTAGSVFAAEPSASPRLRLTGIVAIGDYKRVYVRLEERGRPPEHVTLREGKESSGLLLRRVDAEAGEVHIVQNGKNVLLSLAGQDSDERRAKQAEKEFVEEHTRAHEELQRRERERLTKDSGQVR